jgi:hypothetical protein
MRLLLDRFFYDMPLPVCAALFVAAFMACSQVGIFWGRRIRRTLAETDRTGIQNVQVSILGLVALMLAFSFSMASTRFEQRRSLVVDQANAIGTTLLRTSFLPAPESARIRTLLKTYVDASLALSDARNNTMMFEKANQQLDDLEGKLWSESISASKRMPNTSHTTLYFNTLNQMIDLRAERKAAQVNRVPGAVLLALSVMCMMAMFTVGFGWGIGQFQHITLRFILGLILVLSLVLIIDMDRPLRGLIQISHQSLSDVHTLFDKIH